MFGIGCGCVIAQSKHRFLSHLCSKTLFQPTIYQITQQYRCQQNSVKNIQEKSDPVVLTKNDLASLHQDIKKELSTSLGVLSDCCHYYFDEQGKLFRPMAVTLVGRACNAHLRKNSSLLQSQKRMAMIAEMIHTASLLHDDVIDDATTRRNKPSVNHVFSQKQAILAGDFILSRASILLAQLGNTKAVEYFAHIIDNLVKGELMQLVAKDDINERFNHYLSKTFRKTASLVAYSCKSVALMGGGDETLQQTAFDYGKNIGIAFQLVDDALDFVSTSETMGKLTGVDLNLGLATAPVLFAAEKYPDLHVLIGRRFNNKEDVELAFQYVQKSDAIKETFILANQYASQAAKTINTLQDSVEKEALVNLTKLIVERAR